MHHEMAVRVADGIGNLQENVDTRSCIESLLLTVARERLAVHVLHDDVHAVV